MADRTGRQLGNYRLVRLLGQGGFADVYLAEHIHLGTQAAIKVLSMRLTSDNVEHFRTEARTIARLIHPHIVRVLDFGVEDGTPYLVMDYAPHGSLRQRHPKGSLLPLTTIVDYVKQAAEALQYAHEKKLIHRDIKPENLLVGENHQVLLSDFGIALVAQSTRYQNTQEIVGTAAYMAPEQLQGKPRRASDQYALGIIVYEWLSGERPFHGTFTELYSQHMFVPPPPLHEKVPAISLDIEKVVLTALAKEPQHRFPSIKAFATALEQVSESAEFPTLASSPQPLELTIPSIPPSQHLWPADTVSSSSQLSQASVTSAPSVERELAKRAISRRAILVGLAALAAVGGGIVWHTLSQGSLLAPSSTGKPEPTATVGPATPTTPPKSANLVGYYSDASRKLTIGLFSKLAAQPQEIFTDFPVEVDSDMIVIGGGGRGKDFPYGALLTASYPREDMAAWLVSSKDHIHPDPHRLVGFAIGLKIAGMSRDELLSNHDVAVFSIDSGTASHPEASVNIPGDFVLLGGGFNVHWQGAGNLATASFPGPTNSWTSWTARSKDHEVGDPSYLTTYAIGLRRNFRVGTVMLHVDLSQSSIAAHPTSTASLQQGFALTGGGAEVHWTGAGNLLWRLEPVTLQDQETQQFIASSKDQDIDDPSTITTYALGIQIA